MATILVGYDTETAAVGEALSPLHREPELPALRAGARPRDLPRGARAPDRDPRRRRRAGNALHLRPDAPARARAGPRRASASGLFDVQQHTFSHVPFKDIVYSPGPGLVGTIHASPPEALLEELPFTSRLLRDHVGVECRRPAHAVRLLPRPARPARPARDRARRRAPLRHLVGPQRGERQPDAVGPAVRLRRGGLPRHPRAAVPVLARRRLVRPARLRHGPGAARGAQGRRRRDRGRARPGLRRLLPRLGRDRLATSAAWAGCAASSATRSSRASRSRRTPTTGGAPRPSDAGRPPRAAAREGRAATRPAAQQPGDQNAVSMRGKCGPVDRLARARTRAPRRCSCRGSEARRATSSRPRRSAG